MAGRVWLLDASIYIFRAWFSLPDRWHTEQGMPLNAVYGYAGFLCDFIGHARSGHWVAAAFDESLGTCFRNEIYPQYKASRELPDEGLAFQLQSCRRLTELSGINCYGGPRYEADDYLATLAALAKGQGMPITVLTRDKDLGQLLQDENDSWWDFAADRRLDTIGFKQRFGVRPDQFADYLALVGDSIDDIPGVPGVGTKTAAAVINELGDVESILAQLERLPALPVRGAARLPEKLAAHAEQLRVSRKLAALETAIAELTPPSRGTPGADEAYAVASYLAELGIGGPLHARWKGLAGELACA